MKERSGTVKLQDKRTIKVFKVFLLRQTICWGVRLKLLNALYLNINVPYYGFLKITFHAVYVNENILQSFKSESAPCSYKVSLSKESQRRITETNPLLKMNPKPFHVDITMKY